MDRSDRQGGRNPTTMRNLLKTTVDTKSVVLDEKLTPGGPARHRARIRQLPTRSAPAILASHLCRRYRQSATRHREVGSGARCVPWQRSRLQPFQVPVTVVDARPSSPSRCHQATGRRQVQQRFAAQVSVRSSGPDHHSIHLRRALCRHPARRYLNKIPASSRYRIQSHAATGRDAPNGGRGDWAGVRAQPRGDEDTAQLNHLADESPPAASRPRPRPPRAPRRPDGAGHAHCGCTPATAARRLSRRHPPCPTRQESSATTGGVPCVRYN